MSISTSPDHLTLLRQCASSLQSRAHSTYFLCLVLSSGWTCFPASVPLSDMEFVLWSEPEGRTVGLLALSLMTSPDSPVGGGGLRATWWLRDMEMRCMLSCLVPHMTSSLPVDPSVCSSQHCCGMGTRWDTDM